MREGKKQDMHVHHVTLHYRTYREHNDIYARTIVKAKVAAKSEKLGDEKEWLGKWYQSSSGRGFWTHIISSVISNCIPMIICRTVGFVDFCSPKPKLCLATAQTLQTILSRCLVDARNSTRSTGKKLQKLQISTNLYKSARARAVNTPKRSKKHAKHLWCASFTGWSC